MREAIFTTFVSQNINPLFYFDLRFLFIYLAVVGLLCCVWAFSSCSEWGLLFMQCTDFSLWWLLFPGGSDGKASACNAGDLGSIPGSGRSPGEGNGNPLQHSCLENPMDGGA